MNAHSLQRLLDHASRPSALPSLIWKNIKHPFVRKQAPGAGHWNELGRALSERERYEEALAAFNEAVAISPNTAGVWNNRSNALRNLGRLEEAEASVREALRLKPDFANAHSGLGSVLFALGRWPEAEASFRAALRLDPELFSAHHNLGGLLYYARRPTEAAASYRAALRLRPDAAETHMDLGFALLLNGNFQEGWNEYEWRWRTKRLSPRARRFSAPGWNGEPIGNRVILLHADEGLGDTIQFCRYAPQIASGAKTILVVQRPLVRLLSSLPGEMQIVAQGDPWPEHDLHCPLLSLPRALGTTLDTIPATTPYLAADPTDCARWRQRLADIAGLRVGLCWAGGQSFNNPMQVAADHRRSTTLAMFAPLGAVPGVSFISLQTGPPADQTAQPPPGMRLHDFTAELHDFADTAALMEGLDLVISVDTSAAHLAGALGRTVWLLNCFSADFRWLLDRDDSPWYPSIRQFRQRAPGNWSEVIDRVVDALHRLAAGDRNQLWRRPALPGTGNLL